MNDQSESQHKKFPWVFVISAGVALIAVGFGVASAARLFLYDEKPVSCKKLRLS